MRRLCTEADAAQWPGRPGRPACGKIGPGRGERHADVEYACQRCAKEFETLVRADSIPECPDCHSTDLRKLLSVFATSAAGADPLPMDASPCGSCGNFRGPGACGLN
jgi:putative FmdB family regulatory protein